MAKGKHARIKRKKYALGGIENPNQAITEDQLAYARAALTASHDPLAKGLEAFGGLAMTAGSMVSGMGGSAGEELGEVGSLDKANSILQLALNPYTGGITKFALGGVAGSKINAEGGEIIETPNGEMAELKGASHAQGGIDLTVPGGTEIYSDRLKGPDNKTMAERKKNRERSLNKISKVLDVDPTNRLAKRTAERVSKNNSMQEQQDMLKMQYAQLMKQMGSVKSFALGGITETDPEVLKKLLDIQNVMNQPDAQAGVFVEPRPLPTIADTPDTPKTAGGNPLEGILDNINITGGDALGIAGQLYSTFEGMNNTKANRAADQPNPNQYANYGDAALKKLEESKGFASQTRDTAAKDLRLSTNTAMRRNRGSVRGLNASRALDLATDTASNKGTEALHSQYNATMQAILGQEATLLEKQAMMKGMGAKEAFDNDTADRDAFSTQMAQDINTKGQGLQHLGKNINAMKTRKVTGKILSSMYSDFEINSMTGEMKKKITNSASKNSDFLQSLPDDTTRRKVNEKIVNGEYKLEGTTLVNSKTGKPVDITKIKE